MRMNIRIHRRHKDIPLPHRQTSRSAGLDVHAAERVTLMPGEVVLVPTGLTIETPPGYFFKVHVRSSMAVRHGICLANDVGIIDEDYCGPEDELKIAMVRLYNPRDPRLDEPVVIERGTRIAQIIFEKNAIPEVTWVEMDDPGFAGDTRGGFGSTGE